MVSIIKFQIDDFIYEHEYTKKMEFIKCTI